MALPVASNKVQQCKQSLLDFERAVRSTKRLPNILNGPQGIVSAATIKSVDIIAWGLQRFYNVISWNCRHEPSQLRDVRCGISTFNKPY